MEELTGIDAERVAALEERENTRFVAERPRSMALLERARDLMPRGVPMAWMDDLYDHPPVWIAAGEGSSFTDVDGHTYIDMYVADMSAFCGHGPAAVVDAVAERMKRGNQFLLPDENAIVVARAPGRALRASQVAVHAVRDAGEHRGDPPGTRADRAPDRPPLRRQVPRRGRRSSPAMSRSCWPSRR